MKEEAQIKTDQKEKQRKGYPHTCRTPKTTKQQGKTKSQSYNRVAELRKYKQPTGRRARRGTGERKAATRKNNKKKKVEEKAVSKPATDPGTLDDRWSIRVKDIRLTRTILPYNHN